jgi:hypothetical protein
MLRLIKDFDWSFYPGYRQSLTMLQTSSAVLCFFDQVHRRGGAYRIAQRIARRRGRLTLHLP